MGKIFTIDCDASHLLLLFGSRDFGFVSHSSPAATRRMSYLFLNYWQTSSSPKMLSNCGVNACLSSVCNAFWEGERKGGMSDLSVE